MHWAKDLGASEDDLRRATHDSVAFISELRDEFSDNAKPIVLNGLIGPCGDAYAPEEAIAADEAWTSRIQGIRCNASRQSHAELDECEVLDDGDPVELGGKYRIIKNRMPWLNVFGGCCGSDLRHVTQIAKALAA